MQRQQELLPAQRAQEVKELGWDDVTPVDMVGLEVGYRLIPLVDRNQGGQLLARIKGVRKKLSQELGFLMPSVHIRDNLDLLGGRDPVGAGHARAGGAVRQADRPRTAP